MYIAIPTDDRKFISEHFGKAKYFLIVDTLQGSKTLIENPHEKEENELSGHGKLLKMLVENKVKKIFCFNINPKMEKNLNDLHIEISRVIEKTSIENILKE
ncbi:MAG: NifB/NifX family molybdenum-iron cluster-binding protein [Candidatus Micrarchaeaceae archaeon]